MTPFTQHECEIITKAERLSEVAAILCQQTELAVDLEMDSLHHYQEKVCLIQVSTRDRELADRSAGIKGPVSPGCASGRPGNSYRHAWRGL